MKEVEDNVDDDQMTGDEPSGDQINGSLDDVIELLDQEIQRLKASLETYRLSAHPRRGEIIRWHVKALDERQDALEEFRVLLLARSEADAPRH